MDLSRFEPSRTLKNLRNEIDSLFDRFVERPLGAVTGQIIPTVDVTETDADVIVKADLPGMDENDLDVSIAENILTIRGEKKQEREQAGKTWHLVERSSGSFSRSIRLPAAVDPDRIQAAYRKGVLEITLPKKEQKQTRRINVTPAPEPPQPRPQG